MAWTTPKTDWTSVDAVTHTELNKMTNNDAYLKSAVDTDIGNLATHTALTGATSIHATGAEARAASTLTMRVECRTSDPVAPANGEIWLRTDL